MSNPLSGLLDLLAPVAPTESRTTVQAGWRTRDATVWSVDPIRVLLDGDDVAVPPTKVPLVGGLAVGDRVMCLFIGRQLIVVGSYGGQGTGDLDAEVKALLATATQTRGALDARYLNESDVDSSVTALVAAPASALAGALQGRYARAELGKRSYDFDFTAISPTYHASLYPQQLSVMQCFVVDEVSGDIYVSQVATDLISGKPESYLISRCAENGVLKDSMRLEYGGHGTSIALEHVGVTTYIWGSHYSEDGTQSEVVRFAYKAGVTYTLASSQVQIMNKFTSVYTTPVIDEKNGLIGMRFARDGHQTVELRTMADVKAGINRLLGTVVIPDESSFLQGITLDGDKLYWYSGDTTGSIPRELARYSFATGAQEVIVPVDFGYGPDGTYEDNFREPEGIYLYTDRHTGAKTLFAGVITGAGQSRRRWKVYAYHGLGNESKFIGQQMQAGQRYALTASDGGALRLSAGVTKLSSIMRPGSYYITTGDTGIMTDHPAPGVSGWFFTVHPGSPSGEVKQTLERNTTTTASITTYVRFIATSGAGTAWKLL